MYTSVSGKIVSAPMPRRAAAGVDDVIGDLEVGDLGICARISTADPCRGFEAGGIVGRCVCVNLHNPQTTAEVKQILSNATAQPLSASVVWTLSDQEVLAEWAENFAGVYMPDVRRPWKSGVVGVDDLLQRTEVGDIYPTGHGLLALLDESGCMPDAEGVCPGYSTLNAAIRALREGAGALDEVSSVKLYPPVFGETSGKQAIVPGQAPPSAADLHVDLGLDDSSAWLGWLAAGVGALGAVWWWKERRG